MTKQQIRKHRQEILSEIGHDWVSKEKAVLVSFGTRKLGMPKKEAKELAQYTLDEMIDDAIKRKSNGVEWKSLFQNNIERPVSIYKGATQYG